MPYSSISGGTCYGKLSLLDTTRQVQIFRLEIMPNFALGNQETHNNIEYMYKGFEG